MTTQPYMGGDDYIEKAQRRLINADRLMRDAKGGGVLATAEESQIEALIGIGYILLKISDRLDGPKPGSWAGR